MKVIIAGSTGMIGKLILEECVNANEVAEIVVLVRRPSNGTTSEKVNEVVVDDFTDYSAHDALFKSVSAAHFCIGVYTGQVDDKKFKEITVDYAVEFAKAVKENSPDATLCLLSGAGADRSEKSRASFARYKGMAENQISALDMNFYTFRPGYIYPVNPRKEPNLLYRVFRFLYPVLKPIMGRNSSIKSTELARAMFKVGMEGASQEILENRDILGFDSAQPAFGD